MNDSRTFSERFTALVQGAGAALTVFVALLFVAVVAVVALSLADSGHGEIAGAAFTAIGTVAGGYAGVRVGGHGREQAEKSKDQSQRLVERVAAEVGPDKITEARKAVGDESAARR